MIVLDNYGEQEQRSKKIRACNAINVELKRETLTCRPNRLFDSEPRKEVRDLRIMSIGKITIRAARNHRIY